MKKQGCPTCGRGGTWYPGPCARWCGDMRRRHHDADVRLAMTITMKGNGLSEKGPNAGVRDFMRWGWIIRGGTNWKVQDG